MVRCPLVVLLLSPNDSTHIHTGSQPLYLCTQAFIFDGRNILDHEALRKIGFEVYAIGKPRTKEW